MTAFGYQGVFAACAILTAVALVIIELTAKAPNHPQSQAERRILAHRLRRLRLEDPLVQQAADGQYGLAGEVSQGSTSETDAAG